MIRIALTGGGSGGHVFPLIAVLKQLRVQAHNQNIDLDLRYFGPRDIYTSYIIRENVVTKKIVSAKIRRYASLANIIDIPKFVVSMFQALWAVYWYMPDCLFSKGGSSSVPVVVACWWYRIPIYIHETDVVLGRANQFSARVARKLYTSFPSTGEDIPGKNIELVGNPLREDIVAVISYDSALAKKELGISSNKKLITVLGGSLGSTRINNIILDSIDALTEGYVLIHQVGTANYQNHKDRFDTMSQLWSASKKKNYLIYAFLEERYTLTLAASDLILSRAGGSIFEIAALGIPSILIPLPEAANNHQVLNARTYEAGGATMVIEEGDMSSQVLLEAIDTILSNLSTGKRMQKFALAFSRPRAAETIAVDILKNIL